MAGEEGEGGEGKTRLGRARLSDVALVSGSKRGRAEWGRKREGVHLAVRPLEDGDALAVVGEAACFPLSPRAVLRAGRALDLGLERLDEADDAANEARVEDAGEQRPEVRDVVDGDGRARAGRGRDAGQFWRRQARKDACRREQDELERLRLAVRFFDRRHGSRGGRRKDVVKADLARPPGLLVLLLRPAAVLPPDVELAAPRPRAASQRTHEPADDVFDLVALDALDDGRQEARARDDGPGRVAQRQQGRVERRKPVGVQGDKRRRQVREEERRERVWGRAVVCCRWCVCRNLSACVGERGI